MNNVKTSYKTAVIQSLQFPIQVVTDKQKIKEYHLKKLHDLSVKSLGELPQLHEPIKSLGELPQLHEPKYDQKQWVLHKLNGPVNIWRPYC